MIIAFSKDDGMSPSGSDRLGEGFLLVQVGCSLALWQSKLCLFAFFGFSLFCLFAVFFSFSFCSARQVPRFSPF